MSRDESSSSSAGPFGWGFGLTCGVIAAIVLVFVVGPFLCCLGGLGIVSYRAYLATLEGVAKVTERSAIKPAAADLADADPAPIPPPILAPAKPPPTPKEEADAAAYLREAREFIKIGNRKLAGDDLRKVLADYPDTKAAVEARELLAALGQ